MFAEPTSPPGDTHAARSPARAPVRGRAALRWLLAPWWLAAVFTGAKSFADNPLLGSRQLNARGLHAGRFALAHWLGDRRRARLAGLVPAEHRRAFDRDGFVLVSGLLPAESFARLRDAILRGRFPARETVQGDTVTRRIAIDPEMIAAVPELRMLLDHPLWRGLNRYVGSYDSEPRLFVQTILAGVRQGPADPQRTAHADTFHPTLKSWFFLTDVAESDGPFVYVPGSHRATPERVAWEKARSLSVLDDGDILSKRGSLRVAVDELPALGLPPPRAFIVPANTLVVADTAGFHARGDAAPGSVRVEIWGYGRRTPFLPWTGLDPLSAEPFAHRRAAQWFSLGDLLSRWGIARQPWRDVGLKGPADPA